MSKKVPDHLKGFEEVMDEFSDALKPKMPKGSAKTHNAHESQRFLEQELERLTLLDNFLSKKILLMKNFSQTEELIKVQEAKIIEKKNEIIRKVNVNHQRVHQNLAFLMDTHFKKV